MRGIVTGTVRTSGCGSAEKCSSLLHIEKRFHLLPPAAKEFRPDVWVVSVLKGQAHAIRYFCVRSATVVGTNVVMLTSRCQ